MNNIIFAPATAKGQAALSIIRVSGKGCSKVLITMTNKPLPQKRVMSLRNFFNPNKDNIIIDTCLVCWMPSPQSYTGEDSFEIYCHGGKSTMESFFETLANIENVRFANEGEFTKRALINGKINLIKAEAINDLVYSETEEQRVLAIKQLNKGLTIPITEWKKTLKKIMSKVESSIDFSDEADVPESLNIIEDLVSLKKEFEKVLNQSECFEMIKTGTKVVLTGRPNAGKSSIFNTILKTKKAIVTNIPGTTRDIIEGAVNLKGYPVIFYDTAGINKTNNPVEKEGIRRARELIKKADLVLNVIDANDFNDNEINSNYWNVINKTDIKAINLSSFYKRNKIFNISAISGKGMDLLLEKIFEHIRYKTNVIANTATFLSSARQKDLLLKALNSVNLAINENSEELIAEHLRSINTNLGRILGEVDIEEVLGEIFSNFCIGK